MNENKKRKRRIVYFVRKRGTVSQRQINRGGDWVIFYWLFLLSSSFIYFSTKLLLTVLVRFIILGNKFVLLLIDSFSVNENHQKDTDTEKGKTKKKKKKKKKKKCRGEESELVGGVNMQRKIEIHTQQNKTWLFDCRINRLMKKRKEKSTSKPTNRVAEKKKQRA